MEGGGLPGVGTDTYTPNADGDFQAGLAQGGNQNFRWNQLFIANVNHHYYQFLLQNTQKKYPFCYLNRARLHREIVQMLIHSLPAASWEIIVLILIWNY